MRLDGAKRSKRELGTKGKLGKKGTEKARKRKYAQETTKGEEQ